jgi:hypothetical protein
MCTPDRGSQAKYTENSCLARVAARWDPNQPTPDHLPLKCSRALAAVPRFNEIEEATADASRHSLRVDSIRDRSLLDRAQHLGVDCARPRSGSTPIKFDGALGEVRFDLRHRAVDDLLVLFRVRSPASAANGRGAAQAGARCTR